MRTVFSVFIGIVVVFGMGIAPLVEAQTSNAETFISWRTNAYTPPGYPGRVIPAAGSSVLITAEVITGGRPVDLSKYEIRWFLNDELYQSSNGAQSIVVPVPELHGRSFDVRFEVIDAPFTNTDAIIQIPLGNPQVILSSPNNFVLTEGEQLIKATPYSFFIGSGDDLIYDWTINGQIPDVSDTPQELILNVEGRPTQSVRVNLKVSNPRNEKETRSASIRLSPSQ